MDPNHPGTPSLPRANPVAVLGLGLMGGSLARELAAAGAEVLGYDADPRVVAAAAAEGAIRGALADSFEGLERAELVVLAVPVDAMPPLLSRVLPRLSPDCIVTDLGSTKRSIVRAAEALGIEERFVGSHPLTGDHRAGWAASRQGLYAGATVYVTPTAAATERARRAVVELWRALGAVPVEISPGTHDEMLAWTSHLPQLAATALANALAGAGHPPGRLGPGGRDATRLAGSSPAVWRAICLDNADLIVPALRALEAEIAALRSALESGDEPALAGRFARGQRWSTTSGE